MIILDEFVDFISDSNQSGRFLCQNASRQIRRRVVLCQRLSWRLCSHGAELGNRADPLALGSS